MFFEGQKGNRLCEFIGGNSAPCMRVLYKSLTIWGWVIPWPWSRIEGAGPWRLYRILLRRTHIGRTVAILQVREIKRDRLDTMNDFKESKNCVINTEYYQNNLHLN